MYNNITEQLFKMNFQLPNNFTMVLAGPSKSGKTTFCQQLMKHQDEIYSSPPGDIYFCYNIYQDRYDNMPKVKEFIRGPPTIAWLTERAETSKNITVYVDDLSHLVDEAMVEMFLVSSHHLKV